MDEGYKHEIEAPKTIEQQRLLNYLDKSIRLLKKHYGVTTELYLDEKLQLRKEIEIAISEIHQILEEQGRTKEQKKAHEFPDVIGYACKRWLWSMYGIVYKDIPTYFIVSGPKIKSRRFTSRVEAEIYYDNVAQKGGKVYFEKSINTTDDFKEYLKILREKSHKL